MHRNSFFSFQYLVASAVVACSLALGALTMGALAGGIPTADAATAAPRSHHDRKEKGEDAIITKKMAVEPFNAIEVMTAIEVNLTQAPFPGYVEVTLPEDMLPYLDIRVKDGRLSASYKNYEGNMAEKTVINISAPSVGEIQALSAASVKTVGPFSINDNLLVSASSAAEINFGEISGSSLSLKATSAAEIYALVVDVENLEVSATSAADIKLRGMNVGSVKAVATSAADIILSGRCNRSEIDANSGGDVKTRGLIREKMPIRRIPARKETVRIP